MGISRAAKEEVWFEGEKLVRYNLAHINPNVCGVDNGRVLGYDNAHGYHHRHFMGKVETIRGTRKPVSAWRFTSSGELKMSKKGKIRVTTDGAKGFFSRVREHARNLDRGESLNAEITISFEDAADMMKVLSPERVRVLCLAKKGPASVSNLAAGLKRDTRAVSRDVDLLEQFGLLSTRYQANPGHGKRRIVEPRASRYQLVATV